MEDLELIFEKLNQIQQNLGIWMTFSLLLFGLSLFLYWKYLIKAVELTAQEEFEKHLTKFKTTHHKQVDAIHECYNKFEKLNSFVSYTMNGDKYVAPMDAEKQLQILLQLRYDFKQKFNQHRIVFPKSTCKKVDELIPTIDEFYEVFKEGVWPISEKGKQVNAEANDGVYIAGVWSTDAFDSVLAKLNEVQKEIEDEFREIYGTN